MKAILGFIFVLATILVSNVARAQVTSSQITGVVTDDKGAALPGATVVAIHVPSGTKYGAVTNVNGRYTFPAVRVGGPYKVTTTFVGYKEKAVEDVIANLGTAANVDFKMVDDSKQLQEVVVTTNRGDIFSSERTGAAATFGKETIMSIPTLGRTLNDITKYNAYSNGQSFAGQDSRYNNITIDGSVFNNGFGLGNDASAGARSGVGNGVSSSAISLDVIEEVQVNVAPFDVRQSGFAGAGINAVTRSGNNNTQGSVYYFWKNQDLIGKTPNGVDIANKANLIFNQKTYGFRVGGPLIKNKLFYFANFESTDGSKPALDWQPNQNGATGQVSRTTLADLQDLSSFMKTNFNYDMGALSGYNQTLTGKKFLVRFDYNISDKHKLMVRYSHNDSKGDQLISNSNSSNTAGAGNRNNQSTAISSENTGYIIQDNTRSLAVELNSTFSNKIANTLIATYNKQIEDREYKASLFPTIDILAAAGGSTYTTIGFDPFTPDNKLNYSTLNITDNLTYFAGKHTLTAGASYEHFTSNNLFFYASNGVWTYNSIADFKAAALEYLANPNLTTSAVTAARFNYRYTLLPNGAKPWQTLNLGTASLYLQDEFQATDKLKLTVGLRGDMISFANSASDYYNAVVGGGDYNGKTYSPLVFKDPAGSDYFVNTASLPKSHLYFSPRFGFNFDVFGNKSTQIRGGTGLFLSRVPYVLISNQLGNNGVNIGLINATNTKAYPFTLDPTKYTPKTLDYSTTTGYNINANDPNLRFPQMWKTDIAIDQKLPFGLILTGEFIYNQISNALRYVDVNLKAPTTTFSGDDTRPRFPNSVSSSVNRLINTTVGNVFMLSNTDEGYSYSATVKLEKPMKKGLGFMVAYTNAKARDLSSLASTVEANTATTTGLNYLQFGYGNNDLRHRFVGYINYRLNYGGKFGGSTMFTLGGTSTSGYKVSYTMTNDMNGDGQINDLIYIPTAANAAQFTAFTVGTGATAKTFTPEQQAAAFDAFIENNEYLKSRRGQYAERNGVFAPWLTRMDFTVTQDFYMKMANGKKNTLQFRMDVYNFGNLLNQNSGVGWAATTVQPLTLASVSAAGVPSYRLATQVINGSTELLRDSFIKGNSLSDTYQIQLGVRYIFD
ncbi:MAG: TonB-dependent receptor [Spirosomataceae bacterium]